MEQLKILHVGAAKGGEIGESKEMRTGEILRQK
jgi:hypothetical protein